MSKQKIYNIQGNQNGCRTCELLGLNGSELVNKEREKFLADCGYTHLMLGCGFAEENLSSSIIKRLRVVHDPAQVMSNGCSEYCLVVHDLSDGLFSLPPKQNIKNLLLIPKSDKRLNSSLRGLHSGWNEKFRVCWPSEVFVKELGWSWREMLKASKYLQRCFPYLSFLPPEGMDVYNSENLKADLEPRVSTEIDMRSLAIDVDVSIVVPTYDNRAHVLMTVENLLKLKSKKFEVILVDDGSFDQTQKGYEELWARYRRPSNFVFLRIDRDRPRCMGGSSFRAGIARNCGTRYARGKILLFLDSDILISEDYIEELIEKHKDADLIQAQRRQLNQAATAEGRVDYAAVKGGSDVEDGEGFWEDFYRSGLNWNGRPDRWKFVSTYCLSIKKSDFMRLGGFRKSFSKYGFEDTDLGYRASKVGLRFLLSSHSVYHFKHSDVRSEYGNKKQKKEILLKDSCRIFFLNNPTIEVLDSHAKYLI